DRHRHAVQRTPHVALGERAVGRPRTRARARDVADDDRVQGAVVLVDTREVEVEQLQAAELLAADVGGELPRGAERDVQHRGLLAQPALASRGEYTRLAMADNGTRIAGLAHRGTI